ncbi:MAG: HAMP domain-containing protein [Acidobacteria bacterium]|nr:HAMP domain-containing protein [Acidobacteriota bacterium]
MPWLIGTFVLISFCVLVLLQSSNVWKTFTVETASDTLLLFALSSLNFFAFVIFGFIFLRSVLKIIRERRELQIGSKIKTRFMLYFFGISLLPIIAMAGFSYLFMNRAVERWFIQIPENVVRAPLEVRDQAINDQAAKLKDTAAMLAMLIGERNIDSVHLAEIVKKGDLAYLEISDAAGNTSVSGGTLPEGVTREELLQAAVKPQQGPMLLAATADMTQNRKLLLASKPTSGENVVKMVETHLRQLDHLKGEQTVVRQLGFLTLGVLTFLLIFASSWTAIYVARGLATPIKALAEGADEIAKGNLSHRVDVVAEDELAMLVTAFNQMSSTLEENSEELTERRRYIETVLLSLPNGVISVDAEDRVSTINPMARSILRLEAGDFKGFELANLVGEANREIFERLVVRAGRIGYAAEQTRLHTDDENGGTRTDGQPVAVTATALPENSGTVIVIEDLSELIAAQRASAWREVARRMAHEIKNPLTPIQLSAERIAKRFARESSNGADGAEDIHVTDGQTANVIRDGTETIIREVQGLKAMVDEFSRFARLPDPKLESGDLNELVEQVLALYQDRADGVDISAALAENLPETMIDSEQLKRVFVNLIDNAKEAFEENADEKSIAVKTRYDRARDIIIVEVADNGKGIPQADLPKLFQPYFSTKGRGTGLGLAIVQRIISEHNGKIVAVANQPKGAKFIIELPVN